MQVIVYLVLMQEHQTAASTARSELNAQTAKLASLEDAAAAATDEVRVLRKREAELDRQVTKLTGPVTATIILSGAVRVIDMLQLGREDAL